MLEVLDRKIRQMHQALDDLKTEDLSRIRIEYSETPNGFYTKIDFNDGQSDVQLANTASLLVANIASLKDHLRAWCSENQIQFNGEDLINENIDVALIHDLWNIDKHAKLNKPPRSGHTPKLKNIAQFMRLSTGPGPSSSSFFMEQSTGEMKFLTSGNGSVALVIDADIVDENEQKLGSFIDVCEKATTAWESELIRSGINVPERMD